MRRPLGGCVTARVRSALGRSGEANSSRTGELADVKAPGEVFARVGCRGGVVAPEEDSALRGDEGRPRGARREQRGLTAMLQVVDDERLQGRRRRPGDAAGRKQEAAVRAPDNGATRKPIEFAAVSVEQHGMSVVPVEVLVA